MQDRRGPSCRTSPAGRLKIQPSPHDILPRAPGLPCGARPADTRACGRTSPARRTPWRRCARSCSAVGITRSRHACHLRRPRAIRTTPRRKQRSAARQTDGWRGACLATQTLRREAIITRHRVSRSSRSREWRHDGERVYVSCSP